MTHVSLFAGIGGFDVAAEWAGFETIAQVERDPYCLKVLEKHWPDVYRCTDIREFPPYWDGVQAIGSVTLVSGGFPCQPFSHAGKRRGTGDDRWLWPEMLRVIRKIAPRWIVAENVLGLLSIDGGMVFETVLSDLESAGYEVLPVVCPAAGAGAPHQRQRVFIVAHANGVRMRGRRGYFDNQAGGASETRGKSLQAGRHASECDPGVTSQDVAHAKCNGRGPRGAECSGQQRGPASLCASQDVAHAEERTERAGLCESEPGGERGRRPVHGGGQDAPNTDRGMRDGRADEPRREAERRDAIDRLRQDATDADMRGCETKRPSESIPQKYDSPERSDWWESEPAVGRVAHGIPNRVDRLRALGNAVVPQQCFPILQAIAEIEEKYEQTDNRR